MERKYCIRCKDKIDISQFNKNPTRRDGHDNLCRTHRREYQQEWYKKNREKHVKRVYINNIAVRARNTALLLDYLLKNPCSDCGESDPLVLEFDHVRGIKTKDISSMIQDSWSWKAVEAEIAKCVVRCANCHRRKTAHEQNWKIVGLIERLGTGR
jgi:hypothetical protein